MRNKSIKKEVPTIKKPPKNPLISKANRNYYHNRFNYNTIPSNLYGNNKIKPVDRDILGMIFTYGYQNKQFFMGNTELSKRINVSVATIERSLKKLRKEHFIDYAFLQKGPYKSRRYITYFNFNKVVGKPTRYSTNSIYSNNSTSTRIYHKTNKPSNPLKLTNKQSQLINKITKAISKTSTHSNPISIRRAFISEYKNHKLNINNLTNALVAYKYDKNIKKKSIKSTVGYICSLSNDVFHKNDIGKMKFTIKKQKNPSYDGFDYQDEF